MAKNPCYVKTMVPFAKEKVPIYAGTKVAAALKIVGEMDLYNGVKVLELVEAAYEQGKKDGARGVVEKFETTVKQISYKNPGRPSKKKKNK